MATEEKLDIFVRYAALLGTRAGVAAITETIAEVERMVPGSSKVILEVVEETTIAQFKKLIAARAHESRN